MHSQRVLLALTQAGMSREDAYRTVQEKAMQVWTADGDFQALLLEDATVVEHLSREGITACFDNAYHLQHVETIFARVFAGG